MRLLVVSATSAEMPPLDGAALIHDIDTLVTGVGMVSTAAQVARAAARSAYDAALNFGVCGSFDPQLSVGSVVHITRDAFSELGAEDEDRFLSMEELGLVPSTTIANTAPLRSGAIDALPRVRGITVNTVHGDESSIAKVRDRLNPQVESMEGAAFAYACALSGLQYAQIRAVSNVVERRNRAAWRLDLAIRNLHARALDILQSL